ncbi:MAG TPA: pyrroline-5-carboxylate reductase, partial [Deltaproteobacteria bacterium]|nr:pyrroline-5-carboxylate reductase [Deltaproteobacteria bacterium]
GVEMLSIGFVGAGNMAEAIVAGLIGRSSVETSTVACTDIVEARMDHMARVYGVRKVKDAHELASLCEVVVLAVKPGQVRDAVAGMKGAHADRLVVSIAAGVPLKALEAMLKPGSRIVRVMPNACCLVGQGASVMCATGACSEEDRAAVRRIFESVGMCIELDERHLDAVTALSGSGPAFCFVFLEALADGAVRSGLPRDLAYMLAGATLKGAAEMALRLQKHPGQLKDMVTSPGGTTIEGIAALEAGAFRSSVMEAVRAAWLKAREISEGW